MRMSRRLLVSVLGLLALVLAPVLALVLALVCLECTGGNNYLNDNRNSLDRSK